MTCHEDRDWGLTTLLGQVRLERAYYRCDKCRKSWIPLDEQLEVEASHESIGVPKGLWLLSTGEVFDPGVEKLEELIGVKVSAKQNQLISEGVGREIEAKVVEEMEQAWQGEREVEAEEKPQRLYIGADGREVKSGAVYTEAEDKPGKADEVTYVGGFELSEEFRKCLYLESLRRGVEYTQGMIVLGDGARWIWNQADTHYPGAVEIVDWYHAGERLWGVGKEVYGQRRQGSGWRAVYRSFGEAKLRRLQKL